MATMKATVSANASARAFSSAPVRPVLAARRVAVARAQAGNGKVNATAEVSKLVAISSAAASLLYSGNAMAATELVSLAESDNRIGVIATLFVPALGWVAFNMLQPALNQLDKMSEERENAKRGIAIGLGAAASLFMAQSAEAATQVAQLAESDNRIGVIATLFVPALGWVAFNMLQPALNQLDKMSEERENAKRSIAIGLGAAASLFVAQNAEAATQIAQLAESDNRISVIATLFVPALGWVGFNMLQPALNQLDKMADEREAAKRSIAIGLGAAASLFVAQNAEAATQIAQLAESDNRISVIATLFVPALGWVGFNMLQPALNQLDKMKEEREASR